MKVAVIQHSLRAAADEDGLALAEAARAAVHSGATLVVLPDVPSLRADEAAGERLLEDLAELAGVGFVPFDAAVGSTVGTEGTEGGRIPAAAVAGAEELGSVAVLVGDAVFDAAEWSDIAREGCDVLVLRPRSENDLQAEAVLELALAFSDSLAGLVIVAECDGADAGDPGHGGSAIIALGEVTAEAMGGDDVLIADVAVPVRKPEPREPLPELPTLLAQRMAHHQGARLPVGYPADLTDGAGPS